MNTLIHDILSYINHLKSNHGLKITIHGDIHSFSCFKHQLAPYYIHDIPYCITVKSCSAAWNKCIASQAKVLKKCEEGPFWGMCHAGVEEYICPISSDKVIGFISVSGYKINPTKALPRVKKIADDYVLNYQTLLEVYNQTLCENPPDETTLLIFVKPLSHMLRLLYDLARETYSNEGSAQKNSDHVYAYIVAYLNKNFSRKITIDELSKLCNCSISYINHLFKKRNGKNVNDYINFLRTEMAKKLLQGSSIPVSEISEMVGFSDSNYFSTVFKKQFKISPLNYRKQTFHQD